MLENHHDVVRTTQTAVNSLVQHNQLRDGSIDYMVRSYLTIAYVADLAILGPSGLVSPVCNLPPIMRTDAYLWFRRYLLLWNSHTHDQS